MTKSSAYWAGYTAAMNRLQLRDRPYYGWCKDAEDWERGWKAWFNIKESS